MNNLDGGLPKGVVQDWPGCSAPTPGPGSIGGLIWDEHGRPVYARQHYAARLASRTTQELVPPLIPADLLRVQPASDLSSISKFLESIAAAGIPQDILNAETYETANTTTHSVYDPLIGRRICEVDVDAHKFVSADDKYAFLVEEDSVLRVVDVGSPILQLDAGGLVRTRRGIATIDARGGVEYLREASFMHAASKGARGERAVATSTGGTIMHFDVETGARTWKQTMSRGSLSGWSRVVGLGDEPVVLWCNRYEMALVDLRTKPVRRQKAVSILNYSDRETEIRDVDVSGSAGSSDNNGGVFALTTSNILWLAPTAAAPMHPVLSLKHLLSAEDVSLSLHAGRQNSDHLLTITSQLTPVTAVACLGETTERLPMSARDLYFVDSWPSVIAQSHITMPSPNGVSLYTVGRDGGLYKQTWVPIDTEDPDSTLSTHGDVPKPDELPEPNFDAVMHPDDQLPHKDYDLLDVYVPSSSLNFQWLYRWAFKSLQKVPGANEDAKGKSYVLSDVSSELQDQLERGWLDPLLEKASWNEEAVASRQLAISAIVRDVQAANAESNDETLKKIADLEGELPLPTKFRPMLDQWQVHTANEAVVESVNTMSQPTQLQYTQSQDPHGFAGSFSQPAPKVPSLKVSRRHRDVKKLKKRSLRR